MKKLLLGAMALTLMTPLAANAEDKPAPAPGGGNPAATSSDEMARREAKRAERMERVDTDKDGLINKSEFFVEHNRRGEEIFGRMDADKDGKLSKIEMQQGHKKMQEMRMNRHEKLMKRQEEAPAAGKQ